jgi:hypothetical protein
MGENPDRIRQEIERTRDEYEASDEAERIRGDIEQTRSEMGATMQALEHKADVPSRMRESVSGKKDAVTSAISSATSAVLGKADAVVSAVTGAVPDRETVQSGAESVKSGAQRVGVTRENPLGLAVAGAACGFIVGTLLPGTRMEDDRLGAVADETKDKARELGQEAVERGKQVAEEALDSAGGTARESAQTQKDELSSTLAESAREVGSGASQ